MYSTRPHSAPVLISVRERKEVGEQERNGEMQTLEEEEGETEDKLVSPPPTSFPPSSSLSGLGTVCETADRFWCSHLCLNDWVSMQLVLCNAALERKQDHRGTQAYMGAHTHTECKMKGLAQRSNACSGTYAHDTMCFKAHLVFTSDQHGVMYQPAFCTLLLCNTPQQKGECM